ncbi:SLIT-ROBO Rho GTPase-activating protein 1-like [Ruditapes philippinarum]|uniref:SLIT-ROBO Rho GTPase-activating protein 1-like n=1 Tax=Ruditapes philippinarum TaxID=129788 RepID=UPI00295BCDA4|nr:SLIT-ROBO Rho GTPase-activating protein 1-like [Ruditapes philippinarum]
MASPLGDRVTFARSSLRRSKRRQHTGFGQNIRQQLSEQLKCLESRLESQMAMVQEVQEFYRRKADLEAEYSRNLEKLVKSTWAKHKQEKQKREHWDKFSTFNCWSQLLEITRKQSHDHGILAEICGSHVFNRLSEIQENSQRIFKKCREIGSESHEDMLKILYELQKKNSYSSFFNMFSVLVYFYFLQKQDKYSVNKLKALHARNEYLLNIEVANAAINKYFSDDVSDLMDVRQISAQKPVQDQLLQSYKSSQKVLEQLKLDNDETWKSLEATEKSLTELINRKDIDVTSLFTDENTPPRSPHESDKKRAQRLETEGYYLHKFRSYTLSNNRIARLQAKYSAIQKALGEDMSSSGVRIRKGSEQRVLFELCARLHLHRPPSLPPKPKKRRIGRNPQIGQPKLFGGNLEEYIEATGHEIPTVIKSCIRVLNLYGMHHQGIFRIPGSQVEINDLKNAFEKGDDPLADEEDACEKINSAAGVLKMFFRELKPPLFPLPLFDELIACSMLDEQAKIDKIKELLLSLPRPIIIVMRYLFSFLNHLSEYSDENMMDPYNLAICFGPTLIPIPPDRDQVTFQTNVNEVIKTIIRNQDEIFPNDAGEVYEKCIVDMGQDSLDGMEDEEGESSMQSDDDDEDTEVYEATALYDFRGRTERELSFKKGDNLVLYTKASTEWWEGAFAGKEGLIPTNYVAIKHQPEDKKSISSEDTKSTSSSSLLSLTSKSTDHLSTQSAPCLKPPILETEIKDSENEKHEQTIIVGNVTSTGHVMSQSMYTESTRISDSRSSVRSDTGPRSNLGQGVEILKRQVSSPDRQTESSNRSSATDDITSMDTVLAEIMSDVRSLELQQSSDKRMSLPVQKSKAASKHTPDLVLDLPEGSNSSSPQDGSDRDSPISAAETFAKSNQGTLKKASSMPRNISSSEVYSSDIQRTSDSNLIKTAPMMSTFQNFKKEEIMSTSVPSTGRKFSLEEHHIKSMQTPHMHSFSPPIAEKPKPPIKAKPPVMKKPTTRSPDLSRRLETDLDNVPAKSSSPSSFK